MIERPYSYERKNTAARDSAEATYTVSGTAMFLGVAESIRVPLKPTLYPQTTWHGIDKIELRIAREFINEDVLKNTRRFMNHFVQVEVDHVTGFIRLHRECFDQKTSFFDTIKEILYECFMREAFKVPVSIANSRSGRATVSPEVRDLDDQTAFELILRRISLFSIEVFFDHAVDIFGAVRDEMTRVGGGFTTFYSPGFMTRQFKSSQKRSTVKIYNKVECKVSKKEEPYQAEVERPWRVEFNLDSEDLKVFGLRLLDNSADDMIKILSPFLTRIVHRECRYLRRLVLEPSIIPELRRVLVGKVQQRMRVPGLYKRGVVI